MTRSVITFLVWYQMSSDLVSTSFDVLCSFDVIPAHLLVIMFTLIVGKTFLNGVSKKQHDDRR